MWQVLTVFHEILQYFQICFCHESLFWVRKRGLLFLFWYKYLEVPFCLFWFWTSQNRITRHGFMYLENRDFGNKFGWYLGRFLEFFTKKVIWKYPFVKFIWSRITSLHRNFISVKWQWKFLASSFSSKDILTLLYIFKVGWKLKILQKIL